jgi:hypothetical protein
MINRTEHWTHLRATGTTFTAPLLDRIEIADSTISPSHCEIAS